MHVSVFLALKKEAARTRRVALAWELQRFEGWLAAAAERLQTAIDELAATPSVESEQPRSETV